jgi:hypothetical protein
MGCWNKTCALSNLHINAGDSVYVFLIEEQPTKTNHCESTHLYSPILVPFYSRYDDYGTGENNTGAALPVIIESLKQKLIEKELGYNSYHDLEVKRDKLTVDNLFELMREQRLCVNNPYKSIHPDQPQELKVEFVMMRKDIVDKILYNYKIDYYDANFKTKEIGFNDILEDVDFVINYFQEENNYCAYTEEFQTIRPHFLRGALIERNSKMSKLVEYFDSYYFSKTVPIFDNLVNFVRNHDTYLAREFLTDALKGAFIAKFMENTRRSWIPQCGEGSQNTDPDGHKLLAETVIEVLQKEKEELAYWD